MSYLDWKVGDKLVCVDAESHGKYTSWVTIGDLDGLTAGETYTIRKIAPYGYDGKVCVWLNEIVRPLRGNVCQQHGECGFDPRRFRPVQKRKTDISIFQRLLTNPNIRIEEDA